MTIFNARLHFVHRQIKSDNARRRNNHVVSIATEFARSNFRHALGVAKTLFARAGICTTGVRNNRVSRARRDNFFTDLNGSRRDKIFREDARNSRLAFGVDNCNVEGYATPAIR